MNEEHKSIFVNNPNAQPTEGASQPVAPQPMPEAAPVAPAFDAQPVAAQSMPEQAPVAPAIDAQPVAPQPMAEQAPVAPAFDAQPVAPQPMAEQAPVAPAFDAQPVAPQPMAEPVAPVDANPIPVQEEQTSINSNEHHSIFTQQRNQEPTAPQPVQPAFDAPTFDQQPSPVTPAIDAQPVSPMAEATPVAETQPMVNPTPALEQQSVVEQEPVAPAQPLPKVTPAAATVEKTPKKISVKKIIFAILGVILGYILIRVLIIAFISGKTVNNTINNSRTNAFIAEYKEVVKQAKTCNAQDKNASTSVGECNYDISDDVELTVTDLGNAYTVKLSANNTGKYKGLNLSKYGSAHDDNNTCIPSKIGSGATDCTATSITGIIEK